MLGLRPDRDVASRRIHRHRHHQRLLAIRCLEAPVRQDIQQHVHTHRVLGQQRLLAHPLRCTSQRALLQQRQHLGLQQVQHAAKEWPLLLTVVLEAADQLLAGGLLEVLGEGQMADGIVGLFTEVQAGLVPQLLQDSRMQYRTVQ